jgi:hypothetical protein
MKSLITSESELKEQIEILETREGYKIRGPLIQLQKDC